MGFHGILYDLMGIFMGFFHGNSYNIYNMIYNGTYSGIRIWDRTWIKIGLKNHEEPFFINYHGRILGFNGISIYSIQYGFYERQWEVTGQSWEPMLGKPINQL